MPAPRKTATPAELAKMSGKTRQAVEKQMARQSVKRDKNGRYNLEKALSAMALGAQLDKSKQAEEIGQMAAKGIDPENLLYKSKLAQYRRIVLQGDILEAERDSIRGKLADVEEIEARFTKRLAGFATRIKTWREATIAKRPELRREIDDACRQLQQSLADADE